MLVKARYRYIELTYIESLEDKREKTVLINWATLKKSIEKLDKVSPNRIITKIEILYALDKS